MSKTVKIKLLGVFRKTYGRSEVTLRIEKNTKLGEIIQRLASSSEDFRRSLIDPELGTPLPNAVILLNGKDISAFDGLETLVGDGDEIALIPVIHGG